MENPESTENVAFLAPKLALLSGAKRTPSSRDGTQAVIKTPYGYFKKGGKKEL
jgi:hypothetical protein